MWKWQHLKLIDARNGEIIGNTEIDRKLKLISKKLKNVYNGDVLFFNIDRSFDTIIAIIFCLQNNITFTFSKENQKDRFGQFFTTCSFDGEKLDRLYPPHDNKYPLCYIITTSGTTGDRKQVAVPFSCIIENIEDFEKTFQLTPEDRILFTTSFSFDPSIIEIFLAFKSGCHLIICPDEYRSKPHLLEKAVKLFNPTFLQFTPAVFETLSMDILRQSSLRILLLGGAMFPLDYVQKMRNSNCKIRIFDVYGVTEVSCWATIFEVFPTSRSIFVGRNIKGTELEIDEETGELIIGGRRQCIINGKNQEKCKTGDLVEISNAGWKIVGRKDFQVKIRGVRMNLEIMSEMVKTSIEEVNNAYFLNFQNKMLVLFIVLKKFANFDKGKIEKLFDKEFQPSKIVILEKLELNENGKVDGNKLRKRLDKEFSNAQKFKFFLTNKLNINLDNDKNCSFVQLGINSLLAAELSLFFHPTESETVLQQILSENTKICEFLQNFEPFLLAKEDEETSIINLYPEKQPRMRWAYDLKKCIDGNPIIIRRKTSSSIITASHSGIIVNIEYPSGKLLWKREFETRFEATPIEANEDVVIGGYNGCLYRLDIKNGSIKWKNESRGEIKCPATFDGSENVYIVSYDGIIQKIRIKNGELIWKRQLDSGSPAKIKIIEKSGDLILSTIKGNVYRVEKETGTISWSLKMTGPIFSSPSFEKSGNNCVVASVNGEIARVDVEKGTKMEMINIRKSIFSQPVVQESTLMVVTQCGALVEIHLRDFRIIRIFNFSMSEISFVRSPTMIEKDVMAIISTSSIFTTLKRTKTGWKVERCFRVSNGKVFSTPLIIENEIIVTSRDDWIKCFRLNEK